LGNGSRLFLALRAIRELGPRKLGLYAWYQLQLRSGILKLKTPSIAESTHTSEDLISPVLILPSRQELLAVIGDGGLAQLLSEADEIVNGQVRLFSADPVPLNLTPPGEIAHWTDYERGRVSWGAADPKFIWEPARFGWAFTLGRAYHLSSDERYPEAFWQYFERFQKENPVNLGPNWTSAQEVALRLMAFVFAAQVFGSSPHSTANRKSQIATAVVHHAERIPSSLIYARAQNNNHLLSEAAGLITAALALPHHPRASQWSHLGWKWLNRGLETQISEDGTYMQHSTNYHRLVLQLVLWVSSIQKNREKAVGGIRKRATLNIERATIWLLSLADYRSGHVPNLGPNDGAYIFPLTVLPFNDFRPVVQAAAQAFLGKNPFETGPWNEMALWLGSGIKFQVEGKQSGKLKPDTWHLTREHIPSTLHALRSWAYLRTAQFSDRPGHSDLLHMDLRWRGLNVAQDAGTYLYNADAPWDNALMHTAVHNTVMVNGEEQMTRAGRFLYLDWAHSEIVGVEEAEGGEWKQVSATHGGYRKLGLVHQRRVTVHQDDRWIVEDQLLPTNPNMAAASRTARLHWLLPDWQYELDETESGIRIRSPHGWVWLHIRFGENMQHATRNLQLVRAGELLHGTGSISPTWGWVSPTYGQKIPALSYAVIVEGLIPMTFTSEWVFPSDG
jgi:hypothetical protein